MNIKPKICTNCSEVFKPLHCGEKFCTSCATARTACLRCGETIILKRSKLRFNKGRFCSHNCRAKYNLTIQRRRKELYAPKTIILSALRLFIGKKTKQIKEDAFNSRNISARRRFKIFSRDNFTCQYCGREAPSVILHVDHIIPYSKNGTSRNSNLITACEECNLGKSDMLI